MQIIVEYFSKGIYNQKYSSIFLESFSHSFQIYVKYHVQNQVQLKKSIFPPTMFVQVSCRETTKSFITLNNNSSILNLTI